MKAQDSCRGSPFQQENLGASASGLSVGQWGPCQQYLSGIPVVPTLKTGCSLAPGLSCSALPGLGHPSCPLPQGQGPPCPPQPLLVTPEDSRPHGSVCWAGAQVGLAFPGQQEAAQLSVAMPCQAVCTAPPERLEELRGHRPQAPAGAWAATSGWQRGTPSQRLEEHFLTHPQSCTWSW